MPSPSEVERRVADLWDFAAPAASAAAFQDAADRADDPAEAAVLRSQQARAVGLAGDFQAAGRLLDSVDLDALDGAGGRHARGRLAIERGRVLNSTGEPAAAASYFDAAHDLATACGAGGLAVDALHMSAIAAGAVGGPDAARAWDERALAELDDSDDPAARAWRGTVLNNLGWDLHDAGHLEAALAAFEGAVRARMDAGQHDRVLVARWCLARCLRSLERYDDALVILLQLAQTPEGAADVEVRDEIASDLAALGRDA